MPYTYFDGKPLIFPSRKRDSDDPFFNFISFRKKVAKASAQERVDLMKECFFEHIMKSFPFDEYELLDSHHEFYNILGSYLNEDMPWETREHIIDTLLDLSNHYKYDWSARNRIGFVFRQTVLLALQTANQLKRFMSVPQVNRLIKNATLYMEYIFTLAYQDKLKDNSCLNDTLETFQQIAIGLNPKYFYAKSRESIDIIPNWERHHLCSGLIEALSFPDHKFASALRIYFSPAHFPVDSVIDMPAAFQLFAEIPEWANEYGEARFFMAQMVSAHSNYSPNEFRLETTAEKIARLQEMRPYLIESANAGFEEAEMALISLDQQICKIVYPQTKLTFFSSTSRVLSAGNVTFGVMEKIDTRPLKKLRSAVF